MSMVTTDPFTLEIIKSNLTAISDEMFIAMMRTSKSPIIYEVLDYAVGLTDAQGQLIAQGNGVAGFIGTLVYAVKSVVEKFGAGRLDPGDIVITNDPYSGGGSHLSDVSLVMPIFVDGRLVGFVANKAHWTEVGGKDPGSWTTDATEVYQEGVQFPCIKLFERGAPIQGLLDLLAANVRLPDMTLGDLWAGVAALRVGERRFLDLCRRYGVDAVGASVDHLLDESEQLVRLEMKKLPKGKFFAEDWIDDDGIGNGPFHVQVKVSISDDDFVCDFTGSHPQVPGPINGTRTGMISGVRTVFKAITDPQVPANEGAFRPLNVICPPGTLFTAQRPAPTSTYWETGEFASDLVWKALAPHVPMKLTAGHLLSVCGTVVSGIHPDTAEPFILVEPQVGGWGAGADKDGENGQFCVGDGETYNIPVEVAETRYGLRVDQYALDIVDAGAGKFRGGRGVLRDYRITADEAFLTTTFGRHKYPPWGMAGGQNGSCNYIKIINRDGAEEVFGKTARYRLTQGEVARLVTATGGGFGCADAREKERVVTDLKNGYITPEQAEQHYGVSLRDQSSERKDVIDGVSSQLGQIRNLDRTQGGIR